MGAPLITVVGAGVIGLTTARCLQHEGFAVRVVADRRADESSSGAAGAVWFPYLAQPTARVAVWSRRSYRWLARLAEETPAAGVAGCPPLYVAVDDDSPPAWAAALPEKVPLAYRNFGELPARVRRLARASARPPAGTWCFPAPVIRTRDHLAWLEHGLDLEITPERPVESLDEVEGDLVIVCAGPRAGRLTPDPELRPTFGQVVVCTATAASIGGVSWADERSPTDVVYAFDRGGELVLGGANLRPAGDRHPWERPGRPAPLPELTDEIVARWCRAGVAPDAGVTALAGWRPVRRRVRLERDGRVVFNYGHGGAGFTLAYGCAREVLETVRAAM